MQNNSDLDLDNLSEFWQALSGHKRTVYILDTADATLKIYGLIDFLKDYQGAAFANEIMVKLSEIGAEEHLALFQRFLLENEITVENLSSVFEHSAKRTQLPFSPEAFECAYKKLPSIETYLAPLIREHIEEF